MQFYVLKCSRFQTAHLQRFQACSFDGFQRNQNIDPNFRHHPVMYEEAREKLPKAPVDDPGEDFAPVGQDYQVKRLIQLFPTNFRRG